MSGTKGTATNEAVAIKKVALKHEQKEEKTLRGKQWYTIIVCFFLSLI